jgi:hypothetical protein
VQRLGESFATHLLYDGLMAVQDDFARSRRHWGMHPVAHRAIDERRETCYV